MEQTPTTTPTNNGWCEVEHTSGGGTCISGEKNVMGLRDMFSYRAAFYLIMGRRNKSGVQIDEAFGTWALDENYLDLANLNRTIAYEVQQGNVTVDKVSKGKNAGRTRLTLTDKGWVNFKGLKLIGNLRIIQRRMARIYGGPTDPKLYPIQ